MGVHAANTEGQPTATQKGNGNTEGPRNATSISYTSAYFPRGGPTYLRPYVVSRFLRADSKHADLTHIHAARTSSAHSYKDDVQFQFQSFSSSNQAEVEPSSVRGLESRPPHPPPSGSRFATAPAHGEVVDDETISKCRPSNSIAPVIVPIGEAVDAIAGLKEAAAGTAQDVERAIACIASKHKCPVLDGPPAGRTGQILRLRRIG